MGHLELGEVGLEGHLGVVGLAGVDAGLARHAHVVLPCLEEWRRSNHSNKPAGLLIEYSLSINIGVQAYNPFHTHWHQRSLNKQEGNEHVLHLYPAYTYTCTCSCSQVIAIMMILVSELLSLFFKDSVNFYYVHVHVYTCIIIKL